MPAQPPPPAARPGARAAAPPRRSAGRLVGRTLAKAWTDGIFGQSAQAAFWQTLSLPPLLLGLLGSLGYVAGWFGPETVDAVQREILQVSARAFTPEVVAEIIAPTTADVLTRGRSAVLSVGFVLSLWAGSSALASLVDSITTAHGQKAVRHPAWQRAFALLLYLVTLVGAVLVLPLLAIGPGRLPGLFPASVRDTVSALVVTLYYPVLGVLLVVGLATLYRVVLPRKPPWRRGVPGALLAMLVFLVSSEVLRWYTGWVTGTGYTYGALATPIAFLLFSFFIGFAIILGAQFNAVSQEMWPVRPTRRERRRWRRLEMDRQSARAREDGPEPPAEPGTAPSPADTRATEQLPRAAPSPADTRATEHLPRAAATGDGTEPVRPVARAGESG